MICRFPFISRAVLFAAVLCASLDGQTIISGAYNNATFTGSNTVNANTSATFAGSSNFAAGSDVTFGTNTYLYLTAAGAALTLDSAATATGAIRILDNGAANTALSNAGAITHTSGNGDLYARTLSNSGTITGSGGTLQFGAPTVGYNGTNTGTIIANGSGTVVQIAGNITNTGTGILRAQNSGAIRFTGTNTSANLGTVELLSGGVAQFASGGTLNNTLLSAPTGGRYDLLGGTITGGTIAGNALATTTSGGILNGVAFTGNLSLPVNSSAQIAGSSSFTGGSATFASNTYLYLTSVGASLTFDSASTATGIVRILDNGAANTALSNAGAITHTSGNGDLYARTLSNSGTITATGGTLQFGAPTVGYNGTNTGTIIANGSGTVVQIAGNITNTGTGILRAQNSGAIRFTGTNTSANLGTVELLSGGVAQFASGGTLNNTLLSAPTGGRYDLLGGTITGGTIAGNALATTTSGGILSGVSFTGNLSLPVNSSAQIAGSSSFTGGSATFASNTYLYLTSVGASLTFDSASTATGAVRILDNGAANTALTNHGIITHTSGNGDFYARTFTNSGTGTITASGGTFQFGTTNASYNGNNAGTVIANGSGTTVYISGNVSNTGTLNAQNSGILRFDGTNTTPNLGNVQLSSGGRALLNGTLNITGTLTAPNGGTYELFSGTINGGTVAPGALTFTTSAGTLNGVTLTGDFSLPSSAYVYFTGGTSFTGANATFANSSGIYWQQSGTLSGKAVSQGNGSYLYVTGVNNAVTLAPSTTFTGDVSIYSDSSAGTAITNQGTLTHTLGSGDLYARTFTNTSTGIITANAGTLQVGSTTAGYNTANAGTITANGSGTTVYISGNVTNTGTLNAQNSGILRFDGTNTQANLGVVNIATGGRALLNGTLNITGTLTAPNGGPFELYSGTVNGGNVAPGALSFTSSAGTLNGVTLTGDLSLPSSAYVYFTGGTNFTGANATFANSSGIYWQQSGTLSGKAVSQGNGSYLYVTGVNNAVTVAPSTTFTGDVSIYSDSSAGTAITNQGTLTHTLGSGDLYARTFTNTSTGIITANAGTLQVGTTTAGYNTANAGTITANGSGTTIYISGNVTNTGTLNAQNSGILRFDGTNTQANLGVVNIATGGRALLNGTLNITGTLTAPNGGPFELYSGTVNGGDVAPGALSFTSSAGTLNGVTLTGDLSLPSSAYVYFTGGTSFTGANATFANSSGIYWQQSGTLSGKAVSQGNGSYLYVTGVNNAVTLAPSTTFTGDVSIYSDSSAGTAITNQGTLTHTLGSGDLYARTFTNTSTGIITANAGTLQVGTTTAGYNTANAGTITANGSGTTVYISGNVTNTGTLNAQNSGILRFDGTNTQANLGVVNIATGGRALLNGTLNITGTLTAPNGGPFELYSGTVNGGDVAPGALSFTSSAGTLNGVTLTGDLSLPSSAYVYFTGGTSFTGANATFSNSSGIYWQQSGTLSGKAVSQGNGSYLYVTGVNNAVTLAPSTTFTGDVSIYSDSSAGTAITNQGTLTHTLGSGDLYARTFTNTSTGIITANAGTLQVGTTTAGYNTANAGTITANGSGTTVYISGNVTNTGTLNAQNNGVLRFNGTNTQTNLGVVNIASGGRALLDGTLNITGTLTAPNGGTFELNSGTIIGGTVGSGALSFTGSGGTLSGVTVNGDLNFPSSSFAYFTNGTDFTGSVATIGNNAGIYWNQVGTLNGKNITMGSGSYVYMNVNNSSLTIGPTTTITGDVSLYTGGSTNTTIINQGSLTHTTSSGTLYANTFTNSGSILVSSGGLTIGNNSIGFTASNAPGASITVAGGTLSLNAPAANPIVNQGAITVQTGTLFTGGHLINGASGTISGAGTINGGLTVAGGTVSPGNSVGTLTMTSGNFMVTSAATFAVDISGTSFDELVFQNPTAPVDLGVGLLTLSVTILNAPVSNLAYNIIRISSGGSGIVGTFAGLPNTGSTFTTMFGAIPYTGTVTYQPNVVSLNFTPVPEPSTWAMLGLGGAAVAWVSRRKRRS